MSSARHHAEWLSLLEISGPFLSMPVLLHAFPQGLDAHDPDTARDLRLAYEEWLDNQQGLTKSASKGKPEPAIHTAWVRYVLKRALELRDESLAEGQTIPPTIKATIAEQGETLRPDLALLSPLSPDFSGTVGDRAGGEGSNKPRLLIQVYPASQDLDKPAAEKRWKASPATRMMELLRVTDVRLGLVTNGERWMLVDAPKGGTAGFISWYASLWLEEPLTLRAFRSLLGTRRFFGVPDDETLEALLTESASDQQEVTDQLGYQVRQAVEVLIQAIDKADQDRGRQLLAGVSETVLYEAALTVMMRLVFLFSAEERGLLLLGDPLYDTNYAVSTLRAQLREAADQFGEEVLAYRRDAWPRLLATFRAVHGGVQHEAMKLMAYGGSLFDPERFPFLEGRSMKVEGGKPTDTNHPSAFIPHPLPINNRVVLHLLEALQVLRVKVPGGGPAEARRLSFRALDVEQIGHVYESLLDHTAKRATEPVLGLTGTKNQEPEIALSELEAQLQKGDEPFVAYLKDRTGRSVAALQRGLRGESRKLDDERAALDRLRVATNNDESLLARLRPFIHLIRDDDFDLPAVIPTGSVYVTAGTDRRSTGTHYTPKSLTEPIVQHTLEPLVYVGPAEGLPREQWTLRPPADLLHLKICDMAMGSGAFLVQTCRWLSERLVESWEDIIARQAAKPQSEDGHQKLGDLAALREIRITPEGQPSTGSPSEQLIPLDPDERLAFARRIVADRCLYGVDKNPLAVEMAKLSLWLITLDKQRPFTFLNHALKCGDSLVGADEDMFLRWAHGLKSSVMTLFDEELRQSIETANAKRQLLEGFEVRDVRDAARKQALLAEADAAMARVKLGCDLIIGTRLLDLKPKEKDARLNQLLNDYMAGNDLNSREAQEALAAAQQVKAFHWPFEFPEVFRPTPRLTSTPPETSPSPVEVEHADKGGALPSLVAAHSRDGGRVGDGGFSAFISNPPFVGGPRISTMLGDSYLNYLRYRFASSTGAADLCAFFFIKAFENLNKQGTLGFIATNTIAQGDTRETGLDYLVNLGGTIYHAVSSLPWPGTAAVSVSVIHIIRSKVEGAKILDGKFVEVISSMLDSISMLGKPQVLAQNADKSFIGSFVFGIGFVLEPEDAHSLIDRDPKNARVLFPYLSGEDLTSRPDQSPSRWVINFFDWPLEKAEQYPDCMSIVKRLVKPQRDMVKRDRNRIRWWLYAENRPGLYRTIAPLQRVLVVAQTSKFLTMCFQPKGIVYSHMTTVLAFEDNWVYAVLNSSAHLVWISKYAATLETRLKYMPTDCFETFPFPQSPREASNLQSLETLGETYHEHRRQIMLARQEGLTKTYNRFHDPAETSNDIAHLRDLHIEMDNAVAAAYGWTDLVLGHGYHETAQGLRFTLSEPARREVLARLLKLNHERYAEEQKSQIPSAKTPKKKGGKGKKKSGDEDVEQLGLV